MGVVDTLVGLTNTIGGNGGGSAGVGTGEGVEGPDKVEGAYWGA